MSRPPYRSSRPLAPSSFGDADPRLVLKATPPKAAKTVLARERLGLATTPLADRSVIVVQASSGFGKTALLSQWRREAIASGACAAWFSVDPGDDPGRFVEGLILATRIATSHAVQDQDYGADVGYAAPFERIARWLIELAEFAGDILLVLDDVHALPAPSHESLAYLLHHAPANLRVVLASRKPLPIQENELLAKGAIARVDTESLRLTVHETCALLHNRFGTRIDADTCARLHQLTEGWVLGLQLAIAGMARQTSLREALAACHEHSGDMHRFFVETLVQGLDPRDSAFLVAVSFLDSLHPDLCRAVTGYADSAETLARLCEQTPILTETVDSDWLRIHALAKEFLCGRFDALATGTRRRYCAAACEWLAENRFHEEAARHALRSGQEELAFDLAERSLYEVFATGQVSRIVQWVDRLSPAQLERRPRLRIALGWTLAQSERGGQAADVVAPILNNLAADSVDRFECVQIAAAAAIYTDKPEQAQLVFAPWRERNSGFNPVQRQVSANIDAILLLHQGAPEQARFVLTQGTGSDSEAGRYATGVRDWIMATSFLWQGQVIAAEESLIASLADVEPISGRRSPVASLIAATLAAVLWERDQLTSIDALLADRRDVIDQHAMPGAVIMSYVTASRMAVLNGNIQAGYEMLERLVAIGKARNMPRLCVAALSEQMRLWALQGNQRVCESIAERLRPFRGNAADTTSDAFVRPLVDLQLSIADAYQQIVCHDWTKARVFLAQARPVAEQLRRSMDLLQIHLLDALAAKQLGEDAEARFREGLYLLATLGLKRLLVNTHPLLLAWEEALSGRDTAERSTPPQMLKTVPGRPGRSGSREAIAVTPSTRLTTKEREVVGLLANHLSNKEIALALDVSVDAVKWHLKNLFAKLNAGSRKHLVDKVRSLGLIE